MFYSLAPKFETYLWATRIVTMMSARLSCIAGRHRTGKLMTTLKVHHASVVHTAAAAVHFRLAVVAAAAMVLQSLTRKRSGRSLSSVERVQCRSLLLRTAYCRGPAAVRPSFRQSSPVSTRSPSALVTRSPAHNSPLSSQDERCRMIPTTMTMMLTPA